jgi:predicted dehydrogenase
MNGSAYLKYGRLLIKAVMFSLPILLFQSCGKNPQGGAGNSGDKVHLMTLDPGHFHAALVQKTMYPQMDPEVHIYAPPGPDMEDHIGRIEGFNQRQEDPTSWVTRVYTGEDYLDRIIEEKPGNLVVISGNNRAKTEYIRRVVGAGIHVLSDKPMAIDPGDFGLLQESFSVAEESGVLLYDIMTERYEITTLLQKQLSRTREVFGDLEAGSLEDPAIIKESIHHFFKYVAGKEIKRPAWFFDVQQQGEGVTDVSTHLVDLVQWSCFPGEIIDYGKDIRILDAKRWPTLMNSAQFEKVTRLSGYPPYLLPYVTQDSLLEVYSNGEIRYALKGIHAKVSVTWNYEAPQGGGDTHYSLMRGTIANLVIRQGEAQDYRPELYIEPHGVDNMEAYRKDLEEALEKVSLEYPGISLIDLDGNWQVSIPEEYRVGHEAHFSQVTEKFLGYLEEGSLPEWEVPNMIAKYYTTTAALELARKKEAE